MTRHPSFEAVVRTVNWKGPLKRLRLEPGGHFVDVPRSACVTKGDSVRVEGRVIDVVGDYGTCRIAPSFIAEASVRTGGLKIPCLIKEITSEVEHRHCESLTRLHYRDKSLFGRRARLIASTLQSGLPRVLGYIELASPFYMNKPRAALLDAPFTNGKISWTRWDRATQKEFIHAIVRIARCVVHPEFRGLGVGCLLVEQAAAFARERWQVAGMPAYFLEISADMLKFVPFAEKAGLHYIGDTEGNLGRVAKDLRYLMGNSARVRAGDVVREESFGIVDAQVARMERALSLQAALDISQEELLARVGRLSKETVLRDYALFHEIVSLPKPTYICGLFEDAEDFVARRISEAPPENPETPAPHSAQCTPIESALVADRLALTYRTQVRRTRATHAVQQAFGISPEDIETPVFQDLEFTIEPETITLIIGPSGSGKTSLLDLLAATESDTTSVRRQGGLTYPGNYRPGVLKPLRSRQSLVEYFSATSRCGSVPAALHLLGCVGLSDAFVFLKRYEELSKGQQYRAMLADLLSRDINVWLIDELCANLDMVTANVVADRLQKEARRRRVTLVAAAPHCELFVHSLKPDRVLHLTSGLEHTIWTGTAFLETLKPQKAWGATVRRFALRSEAFDGAWSGRKTLTIRKDRLSLEPGPILFMCGNRRLLVKVTHATHVLYKELKTEHARRAGHASLRSLRRELSDAYPGLNDTSALTLIEFEPEP